MSKLFIDFAAVKAAISMEQVLDHYGLRPDMRSIRNGDGLEGACPIHQGSNKTQFKVSLSKNCWNCFSDCKCGGNVLDFIAKMEQVDVYAAALRADEWFNLGLSERGRKPQERSSSNAAKGEAQSPVAAASGHPPDKPPRPPTETISSAPAEDEGPVEIGCNPPLKFELKNLKTDHAYFAERGMSPETVAAFGLGYCAKGTMSGRIAIPIHNHEGALVGYAGRWPGEPPEERPKYKLPKGFRKSAELFNLHRALQEPHEKPLVIVEGYFDVLKLWQLGWNRVVALMGCSLSVVQEELLRRSTQAGSRIALMFDEDDAGRKGREQALARLATFAYVHVLAFPREGMQPEHLEAEDLVTLLAA